MSEIRIQKFFSDMGIMSRRSAEVEILKGNVTVNGNPAVLGQKVEPSTDIIKFCGKEITNIPLKQYIYIMLNKPAGIVSTMKDEKERMTVADLTKDIGIRIYPVGRLDMYSEGLLIMTNDGDFTKKLTHPSHNIEKKYVVLVSGIHSNNICKKLMSPMIIDGYSIKPVEVKLSDRNIFKNIKMPSTCLEFTLHEGRNRQIRKMCKHEGLNILRLRRISIGDLKLGTLPCGKWRYLNEEEIKILKR